MIPRYHRSIHAITRANHLTKFNRRPFISISVVAGVGLGLGFGWPVLERLEGRYKTVGPLGAGDVAGDFEPWIRISPDNTITVTISRSEMSQGVETALAMIVAEEMDADWSTMRTQQANSDMAYGNQHTAASDSVRQLWAPMWETAATARRMLISAAAGEWGIDADLCSTSSSRILHPDGQRQMTFGSIAAKAAQQSIPLDVQLKKIEDFEIAGPRMPRLNHRSGWPPGAALPIRKMPLSSKALWTNSRHRLAMTHTNLDATY